MYPDIDDSLNSLVYRTNTILRGRWQAYLKDFNITSEQWAILNRLIRKDGYNQKELSVDSFKEPAAITRTLDLLERKGLVERRRSATDGREYLVFITEDGKQLLRETRPRAKQYNDVLKAALRDDEMATLKALLRKLGNGLQSGR
ncbi:MarR family transcriptional regulator [Gordonia sp. L191]|uniref:MarR family winged helix-turn-helix transcriptional regulator n=1 Tax=Gordonia sp. L191 TaxID=2982699 RepID=UPI0024C08DE6|nr:MarR family transcriptional regulator [Gordonia sp. L191]WHU49212.1 MarR family transcriptional regulator [Gordonia sp. L191]